MNLAPHLPISASLLIRLLLIAILLCLLPLDAEASADESGKIFPPNAPFSHDFRTVAPPAEFGR